MVWEVFGTVIANMLARKKSVIVYSKAVSCKMKYSSIQSGEKSYSKSVRQLDP